MTDKIRFKDLSSGLKAVVVYVYFQFGMFILGLLLFALMIVGF